LFLEGVVGICSTVLLLGSMLNVSTSLQDGGNISVCRSYQVRSFLML
jgi:hypothetical protein